MATHIFMAADTDPTVMIGGTLPLLHSGYRVGHGDTIIAESCEYCNSFLSFFPTVAVILNVEADHLDFFKDLHDVEHSFRRFAELVPADGHVVANWTTPACARRSRATPARSSRSASAARTRTATRKTLSTPTACPRSTSSAWAKICPRRPRGRRRHNVMNALAAASAAYVLGIRGEAVERGLATFTGAGRRFEKKGSYHGADVYDDYAHPSRRAARPADDGEGAALPAHRLRPSSRTPTRAQRRSLRSSCGSSKLPTCSFSRKFTPRASRMTSAFRPTTLPGASPARSTAQRSTR